MSALFFIVAAILLQLLLFLSTATLASLRNLYRKDSKKSQKLDVRLFGRKLHQTCLGTDEKESLLFASAFLQNVLRFGYAALCTTWILASTAPFTLKSLLFVGLFVFGFGLGDYFPRWLAHRAPEKTLHLSGPMTSFFLLLLLPLSAPLQRSLHFFTHSVHLLPASPGQTQQEILEMIEDATSGNPLDIQDLKLLASVIAFKDRIAREIMVPRVEIFSLPHDMSLEKAAEVLIEEGYTRTPVYKNTLDNIVGVLMYKDLLVQYIESVKTNNPALLGSPIANFVKPVMYTPETKKISHLLQEFRKKQLHLAIIVDEYGGTEGIVTIEDILEAIVGDIADEYDQEEALFVPLPQGGWMVDARMPILDIEEQLGIEIPQGGDYDTIGGYIFHEAGTIPVKGFCLHKPDFEIEVLRSNDRRVEKIRIQPISPPEEDFSEEA